MEHLPLGIHIALSKSPLGLEPDFVRKHKARFEQYKRDIEKNLTLNSGYKKRDVDDYINKLYEPCVFHVFSHFDLAFISLIDTHKFPQRVFEPYIHDRSETSGAEEKPLKSVSYQILSGSIIRSKNGRNPKDVLKQDKQFLKIIQLKLNNGLLIGNGAELFESCIPLIEKKLINEGVKDYILIDSYNWSEIIIVAFHKEINSLARALFDIRELNLGEVTNVNKQKRIVKNSLYKLWGIGEEEIGKAHFFCESLSYVGMDFKNYKKMGGQEFLSNIEFQVKPGHAEDFMNYVKEKKIGGYGSELYMKNGRTDFWLKTAPAEEKETAVKLGTNISLYNLVGDNRLKDNIRKFETKPLFDSLKVMHGKIEKEDNGPSNIEDHLKKYKLEIQKDVNRYVRQLNVSRNTRKKISKIIYNYNLGIQDPILYMYMIDFRSLLMKFETDLRHFADLIVQSVNKGILNKEISEERPEMLKSKFYEEFIETHVKVFEEAYQDRILNNYNYEDINEFSLDVNSSFTNMLSATDAVIKYYAGGFGSSSGDAILTTISYNETRSNRINVNYNIEHISSPPLVFATLHKEILNIPQALQNEKIKTNIEKLNEEVKKHYEEQGDDLGIIHSTLLDDFLKIKSWAYFEIDLKKYFLTYFQNIELYEFWHWTYCLQQTQLYASTGYFDEANFCKELTRLLLVIKAHNILNPDSLYREENLKCPIPELRTFWDAHFNRIRRLIDKVVVNLNHETFEEIVKDIAIEAKRMIRSIVGGGNCNTDSLYEQLRQKISELVWIDKTSLQSFDELCDHIFGVMTVENKVPIPGYPALPPPFVALSALSFYSLLLVRQRFGDKISLLRRDFTTGEPSEHFLKNAKTYYVDPFGGLFVNSISDREEFMKYNNKMLYMIWHIGNVLKKNSFVKNDKEASHG